jgi:hypothetical protein
MGGTVGGGGEAPPNPTRRRRECYGSGFDAANLDADAGERRGTSLTRSFDGFGGGMGGRRLGALRLIHPLRLGGGNRAGQTGMRWFHQGRQGDDHPVPPSKTLGIKKHRVRQVKFTPDMRALALLTPLASDDDYTFSEYNPKGAPNLTILISNS